MTASPGEFISIIGPSGCGKSTLLTLIAGLEHPVEGTVEVKGEVVGNPRRDVGFIFQRDALLPWKSLRENVSLALLYRGVAKKEARAQAQSWLERFGLGEYGDRFPYQVSGGQRKRASIAATMVYEPDLMLMDEPFASLDVQTRDLIEDDILRIWSGLKDQTIIFVTHDLEEAVALSDRVIVFSRGPGTIVADDKIDLPRPRDVREIRSSDQFRKYYESLWERLRVEVSAAQARTGS
jgi:NitT/TauT family transport system ATP-binding protein